MWRSLAGPCAVGGACLVFALTRPYEEDADPDVRVACRSGYAVLETVMSSKQRVPRRTAADIVHAQRGSLDDLSPLVEVAIARGADADRAVRAACSSGCGRIIDRLLERQATVPASTIQNIMEGQSMRHMWPCLRSRYAETGDAESATTVSRVALAAKKGADPSHGGETQALYHTLHLRDAGVVRLLLDLGADPDAALADQTFSCRRGSTTALHLAISSGDDRLVQAVLAAQRKKSRA